MFQGFLLQELGESGGKIPGGDQEELIETQESSILLPVYWDGTKLQDKGLVS